MIHPVIIEEEIRRKQEEVGSSLELPLYDIEKEIPMREKREDDRDKSRIIIINL